MDIWNARDERKAERMAKGEDEIVDTTVIDIMAEDVKARVGFEKRVKNMDGLARRGGDNFCMEGSIPSGDRHVELDKPIGAMATVDATSDFAAIAEMDMSPI